ncbi:MAG: GIY-YIG nuclease family protein [Ekhidna sp.]|nr:GIY-YIG nuclease family protein [Ekhidna sp.]
MNVDNRMIFCHDNLDILRGINSDCIDLIYADPPFNKKKTFTAPVGSSAEGAEFSDIFKEEDIKDEWLVSISEDQEKIHNFLEGIKGIEGRTSYTFCYLAYMAVRLMECHRILKDTGSLYLHCDPTMSHYLKILLDCIFGEKNFRNEIVWCYTFPGNFPKDFPRRHDIILRYSKTENYFFYKKTISTPYKANFTSTRGVQGSHKYEEEHQKIRHEKGKTPEDWWTHISNVSQWRSELLGYPTQKPLALLERIIQASSKKGNIVLDPFCGCATTCVAAERLKRQWIGIDVSVKAYELVKQRLAKDVEREGELFYEKLVKFSTDPPKRTDQEPDYLPQKYVYIISHPQYEGEYKVGIASDVKSRLGSYQTGDPGRNYKLEHSCLTPYFREIEAYIHKKYENKHEWVQGDLKDIQFDIEHYEHENE